MELDNISRFRTGSEKSWSQETLKERQRQVLAELRRRSSISKDLNHKACGQANPVGKKVQNLAEQKCTEQCI